MGPVRADDSAVPQSAAGKERHHPVRHAEEDRQGEEPEPAIAKHCRQQRRIEI